MKLSTTPLAAVSGPSPRPPGAAPSVGIQRARGQTCQRVLSRHGKGAHDDPLVLQGVTTLLGGGARVALLLLCGRTQESDADHLGLVYMTRAGYHPSVARDLCVQMQEAARGRQGLPPFPATHRSTETRIQQITPGCRKRWPNTNG
jgi:predicted Zn-dependent protease